MRINLNKNRDEAGFAGLMIAGLVAGLAGTAVSAMGARSSAEAQKKAADYNSAVERNNAGVAAQQAKFDANQIQQKTTRQLGLQRAAMASSGFDPNSGSFTDVSQDTARRGELEKLSSIYQGRLGVMRSSSAAQLSSMQGAADLTAGNYAMAGTILGGASSATQIGARYYLNTNNPTF